MTKKAPRALIVGGSLGGQFAATSLRAIGWDVDIFERSSSDLDSRGGGVVLQGDVLTAFRFGNIPHGNALGVQSRDRIYLDRRDNVIHRALMPQTQTSWNMLYAAMKRTLPAERVHAGEHFLRYEEKGDSVTAHFASGRVESGDLLIGADGPLSTVRRQVMPGVHPTYAGYVAWRGLIPENDLSPSAREVLINTFAFQEGPGHLMLEYLVPGDDESTAKGHRRWNWVWYRKVSAEVDLPALLTDQDGKRHLFSLPPGSVKDADLQELRQASADLLAPTFQRVVEATTEPFVQAILDLQVPQMVFGKVVLLGDSAFIPRPHTAGSTAKAAANAVTLAEALDRHPSNVPAALEHWQQSQLKSGKAMTEWGMDAGDRILGISRSTAPLSLDE